MFEHIEWKSTDVLLVVVTFMLVLVTLAIYKTNARLTHFTGALESHSTMMLRIEAARGIDGKPIEVIWWDKSLGAPPSKRAHGEPAALERIYLLLPEDERRFPPSTMERVISAFS